MKLGAERGIVVARARLAPHAGQEKPVALRAGQVLPCLLESMGLDSWFHAAFTLLQMMLTCLRILLSLSTLILNIF